jgi:hypothetical protein
VRIAITGGRDHQPTDLELEQLVAIVLREMDDNEVEILHGDCRGVDRIAAERGLDMEPTDKSYKVYVPGLSGTLGHGSPTGKFYFQHLSAEQRTRFVELVNSGTVKACFYVTPFFMQRLPAQPSSEAPGREEKP